MYCNKCGKELPTESLFCPYCGEKQEVIASHGNDNSITNEQKIEEKSIQSTQTNDKTKAGSIADEIIANLKMVGLAVLLSALYIGVFWICHIEDRKPAQTIYEYGQSCYDEQWMPSGTFDWEEIYHSYKYQYSTMLKIQLYTDDELQKMAIQTAENNKKQFLQDINVARELRAKEDFMYHIKYSLLISLVLTIFGRYLIKGIKWVVHNKS